MAGSSISIPRSADLRTLIASFTQISTRLSALEKALGTTTSQAGQTSVTLSQSNSSISNLAARIAALESGAVASGAEVSLRADDAVAINTLVRASSPVGCVPVDASALQTIHGIVGISETSGAKNGTVTVRRFGNMTIGGAAFTPGEIVYWGRDGFTHVPDYVPAAIPVGVATGTSSLFVLIDNGPPTLVTHGPYTDEELFLPVAYALVKAAVELMDTLIGQPDGIVVKVGTELQTRAIITSSASGVLITNGDGVAGDPHIELG